MVLGKWVVTEGLPPQSSLAVRFGIAAILLLAIHVASRRDPDAASGERRWLLLLGGVGYAVETSLFFAALAHGTVAGVTLLFYTYPVMAALAHMATRHARPKPRLFVALALSVGGAGLVVASAGSVALDAAGALFALGAAVAFTTYMLGSEHFLRRTDPMTAAMWLCAAASCGLTLSAAATGTLAIPGWTAGLAAIAGMGLATAGAFTFFLSGLRRIGSVRTGIISTFEPLSASLLAFVFLGEALAPAVLAGGALVIAGAILAVSSGRGALEPSPERT